MRRSANAEARVRTGARDPIRRILRSAGPRKLSRWRRTRPSQGMPRLDSNADSRRLSQRQVACRNRLHTPPFLSCVRTLHAYHVLTYSKLMQLSSQNTSMMTSADHAKSTDCAEAHVAFVAKQSHHRGSKTRAALPLTTWQVLSPQHILPSRYTLCQNGNCQPGQPRPQSKLRESRSRPKNLALTVATAAAYDSAVSKAFRCDAACRGMPSDSKLASTLLYPPHMIVTAWQGSSNKTNEDSGSSCSSLRDVLEQVREAPPRLTMTRALTETADNDSLPLSHYLLCARVWYVNMIMIINSYTEVTINQRYSHDELCYMQSAFYQCSHTFASLTVSSPHMNSQR